MATIDKNDPPRPSEVDAFLEDIDFNLPSGFIEFFSAANGAEIVGADRYIVLWPLTDMIMLNSEYNVSLYAPGFFIFGSDGGDMAFAIKKESGYIYEMPFIGMGEEESFLISESFNEFISKY